MDLFLTTVLALNTVWFAIGFWFFSIRPLRAARLLVPWRDRYEASFAVLIHALRFLGGMNLSLALYSLLLVLHPELWHVPLQVAIPLMIFGVAHGSQFYFNLQLAIRQARGERYLWPVWKGPMLGIFLMDAILCVLNFTCGIVVFPPSIPH